MKLVKPAEILLPLAMSPKDKADILLAVEGVKPAAYILLTMQTWRAGEQPRVLMTQEKTREVCEAIKLLNIPHVCLPSKIVAGMLEGEDGGKTTFYAKNTEILIGSNKENLRWIIEAHSSQDHAKMGRALGIPETAIEAFMGKRARLDLRIIPSDILMSDSFAFLSPTLSHDYWQEELKMGKHYADHIHVASREIYREVLKRWQENIS